DADHRRARCLHRPGRARRTHRLDRRRFDGCDAMTGIWGIVNTTPDSFSDGGRYTQVDAAIAHGLQLWRQGATVVDVGGESTRPGAVRVAADQELARVIPVVEALAAEGVPVSIDTLRASTAEAAVDAGARIVNDVSGGLADEQML